MWNGKMLMKLVTTTGIQELKVKTDTNSEEQFFAETFSMQILMLREQIVTTRNKPYKHADEDILSQWAVGEL